MSRVASTFDCKWERAIFLTRHVAAPLQPKLVLNLEIFNSLCRIPPKSYYPLFRTDNPTTACKARRPDDL